MNKETLRNQITEGNLREVISGLRNITSDRPDLHNEILHIAAQFNENERQKRLNVVSEQEFSITRNRINSSILAIIDRIDETKGFNKNNQSGNKIVIWLGIIATIVTITGYTLKEIIDGFAREQKPMVTIDTLSGSKQGLVRNPIDSQTKKNIPSQIDESVVRNSTSKYFDENQHVQAAFIGSNDNLLLFDEQIKSAFKKQGITFSNTYFRKDFIKKFGSNVKTMDVTDLRETGLAEKLNCICQIDHSIDYQQNQEEGVAFYMSIGKMNIYVLNIKTGKLEHVQISEKGAGISREAALESLEENLVKSEKLNRLNLDQCK